MPEARALSNTPILSLAGSSASQLNSSAVRPARARGASHYLEHLQACSLPQTPPHVPRSTSANHEITSDVVPPEPKAYLNGAETAQFSGRSPEINTDRRSNLRGVGQTLQAIGQLLDLK